VIGANVLSTKLSTQSSCERHTQLFRLGRINQNTLPCDKLIQQHLPVVFHSTVQTVAIHAVWSVQVTQILNAIIRF
jgi:hypothetical protein